MAKTKVVFKSNGKNVSLTEFMKNVEKDALLKVKDKLSDQNQKPKEDKTD